MNFVIYDWAGNKLWAHGVFKTLDDAEMHLSEFLGDAYETDRQEYSIECEDCLPNRACLAHWATHKE